ncbi:MAG TPA: hypothetical protein P5256_09645 [Beijerinckiaceae bacterium]|nr:hypothetical protein [Hyphomicrobiales bacterium]HRY03381.1 hypothetical protein [Beijerinckiaceae bacterium]
MQKLARTDHADLEALRSLIEIALKTATPEQLMVAYKALNPKLDIRYYGQGEFQIDHPVEADCGFCTQTIALCDEIATTWTQWRCPCCGNWNDSPPSSDASDPC